MAPPGVLLKVSEEELSTAQQAADLLGVTVEGLFAGCALAYARRCGVTRGGAKIPPRIPRGWGKPPNAAPDAKPVFVPLAGDEMDCLLAAAGYLEFDGPKPRVSVESFIRGATLRLLDERRRPTPPLAYLGLRDDIASFLESGSPSGPAVPPRISKGRVRPAQGQSSRARKAILPAAAVVGVALVGGVAWSIARGPAATPAAAPEPAPRTAAAVRTGPRGTADYVPSVPAYNGPIPASTRPSRNAEAAIREEIGRWGFGPEDPNLPDFPYFKRLVESADDENRYDAAIAAAVADAAPIYAVPKALVKGIIRRESAFNPRAHSHAGAIGLMQVMPFNAKGLGYSVDDLWDPHKNIMAGTRLLAVLLKHYKGDEISALTAYNARPRDPYAPIPQNGETPEYVEKVLSYYWEFRDREQQERDARLTSAGGEAGAGQ